MMIREGDRLPVMKITTVSAGAVKESSTELLFKSGRSILFGVPGAFTPTCSEKHLPGYQQMAGAFATKGIGTIVCLSVNDASVMKAWAKQTGVEDSIVMLADGSGWLTQALGLELDLSGHGMGMRCKRFGMLIEDMVVRRLGVEPPGGYGVSSAEAMLALV